MKNTKSLLLTTLASVAMVAGAQAQLVVFEEDFGALANATTITTSNTDLTYVRVGTGTGSIEAQNPSNFGAGASAVITGPTTTSLNGIGVGDTLDFDGNNSISFALDFRLTDTSGQVVFGLGTGNRFTGDSTFSTAQGLFWLQANGTTFQRRTSDWVDMTTLTINTNYSLLVEANTTTGLMTVSLNGSPIAEDVAVTTASITAPTGFRVYSVNGSDVEVDNISITAIPEPSSALLLGVGLLTLVLRRRCR